MISSFCNSEQLSVSSIALHQSCHCSSPAREVLLLLCPRLKLDIIVFFCISDIRNDWCIGHNLCWGYLNIWVYFGMLLKQDFVIPSQRGWKSQKLPWWVGGWVGFWQSLRLGGDKETWFLKSHQTRHYCSPMRFCPGGQICYHFDQFNSCHGKLQ